MQSSDFSDLQEPTRALLPVRRARLIHVVRRTGRVAGVVYAVCLAAVAAVIGVTSLTDQAEAAEVRAITWPVAPDHLDNVQPWSDTYGAPRSGGRSHLGVDICGPKMTPLVAAADGEISWLRHSTASGNNLTITDADGWEYHYIHINNDTPGTDDGVNNYDEAFGPGIERGVEVRAGQVVAYLGDSGNAEGTCPHLHFEIEKPDGSNINPTPSVDIAAAAIREGAIDPDLGLTYPSLSSFAADALTTLAGTNPNADEIATFRAEINDTGVAGALEPLVGPDSIAAGIDRLYFATFLRLPDADGYQYWIEQEAGDWNVADISQFFATSDEFVARFGDKDYAALLDQIYRDMFGRAPDSEGRDYWLERLADPDDPVTPGTVLSYFSDGDEAKIVAGTRSELVALTALFEDRMPDANEIAAWQELRESTSFGDAVTDRFLS